MVQISKISFALHGAAVVFTLLHVVTLTTALEGKRGVFFPVLRLLCVVGLLLWQGGTWFGLEESLPFANVIVITYFVIGLVFSYYIKLNTQAVVTSV